MNEMNGKTFSDQVKEEIFEAHIFWFKRRLLFNILVGISGFIGLSFMITVLMGFFDPFFLVMGAVMWGLVANGLYSIGFAAEAYVIHKSEGKSSLRYFREALFWTGTSFYMIASLLFPFSIAFSFFE